MASNASSSPDAVPPVAPPPQGGLVGAVEDQLALRGLIWEYLIPVETNTLWYTLGGVLGIAIGLEFLTGFLLTLRYDPDAGRAYQVTVNLMHERFWSFIINFHYLKWYMGNGWGWWMVFGWIWMVVFWGLIIWAVYTVISRLSAPRGGGTADQSSAMEILERRYASGELTHEQFEEMRRRLTGTDRTMVA